MKTKLQKEMRKIRIQLKAHDISEERKALLRKELQRLRETDPKYIEKQENS